MDLDGRSSNISPLGSHLLLLGSLVDNSLKYSRYLYVPGTMALRGAFNCFSKYDGASLFQLASESDSNLHTESLGNLKGKKTRRCRSCSRAKSFAFRITGAMPPLFCKISSSLMSHFKKEIKQIQLFPFLSLAAALLPPHSKLSPKILDIYKKKPDLQIIGQMDQIACVSKVQECSDCTFADMNWVGHTSEAATGIEFPKTLQNCLAGGSDSSLTSEILVGTGSRSMRVMRIKTLRIYAFGLYVHPASVCQKLGPKYASMPISELNNQLNFFEDLLREDIDMTVRLVINFNGLKVNSVRDTFEKSLRNRLSKVNPQSDYQCLRTFASHFTEDIPLSVGTTIDFRQTAKGQLITEIGGKQIGTVDSKDLCRAFFDMYIGDVSGSVQTKDEITRNVASIIRRC